LLLHVQADEADFEVLAQEALPLRDGPVDARLGDGDLRLEGAGDGGEEVEELSYCTASASWYEKQ
jgi:hypothetical protein